MSKPEDDLSRLRLIGVAQANLGQQVELRKAIEGIEPHLTKFKVDQEEAKKTAKEKAEKEKKKEKEVKAAEKKAHDQFQKNIKKFENVVVELKGYLAAMNGDFKTAKEALSKRPSQQSPVLRHLAYGDHEKAAELSKAQIDKKDKQTIVLAKAIHALYHAKKDDAAWKVGFEDLRKFGSEVDLESPVFARLAPIAKELGYPADWRIAHKLAGDLLPRPNLDELGPLHWTPPPAPEFSLPDQHQKKVSLSEYRGKPVILVFYLGAGCLHCTEQMTAMADRYSDFEKSGLSILAISTDDIANLKDSQDNYSKGDIPFPIVSDAAKNIFKQYTAHDDFEDQPLHGTFVLNAKGQILWSDISADPFMDIDFLIKESRRLVSLHK